MHPLTCPECREPLDGHAPEGLCPRCLLAAAVSEDLPSEDAVGPARANREGLIQTIGDYEILECLARGGMGVVYKARHRRLDRIVAIKTVPFGSFTRQHQLDRFQAEAAAAARLRHPHLVAVHEIGEWRGQPWFAMDYIAGPTLAGILREGPVAMARAVRWVRSIAEAVHYAHEHGILHRDLKPSNILVDGLDQPHVADFGLAKDLSSTVDLTLSRDTLGSPNYMAPEQCGRPSEESAEAAGSTGAIRSAMDNRSAMGPTTDVYGLGAVLFHLLTGQPPFLGESVADVLLQVREREPVAPRLFAPHLPADLNTIVLKCLEKDPRRRYPTARDLAEELARWQAGEPIQARPVSRAERMWRWCRRKPAWAAAWVTMGLLGASLVVGLGLLQLRQQEVTAAQRLHQVQTIHTRLEEARSLRQSLGAGRRTQGLEAIRQAIQLQPDAETRAALRAEAIALLVVPDVSRGRTWRREIQHGDVLIRFDAAHALYALRDASNDIEVRRVADDAILARLPHSGHRPRWIQWFSPDSKFLVAHHEPDEHWVWDIERAVVAFKFPSNSGFALTADGRQLLLSDHDGTLRRLRFPEGTEVARLPLGQWFPWLSFGPDPEWFLALGKEDSILERRETSSGRLMAKYPAPASVTCAAVSFDGTKLAIGSDQGHIAQWNLRNGQQSYAVHAHEGFVSSLTFNRTDDWLATQSWDGTLRLSDAATGAPLVADIGGGFQMAVRPDDRGLAAAVTLGEFHLVDVSPRDAFHRLHPPVVPTPSWSLAFSPDGRCLVVGEGEGVRLWDFSTRKPLRFLPVGDPRSVLFTPQGDSLITSGDAGLLRWSIARTEKNEVPDASFESVPIDDHKHLVTAGASKDGRVIVAADFVNSRLHCLISDGTTRSGFDLGSLPGTQFVSVSPDGTLVAAGSWIVEGVQVWSLETRARLVTLPTATRARVQFSPDGRWLAVSCENVRLYRTTDFKLEHTFELLSPNLLLSPMAFSSDGRLLAVGNRPYRIELYSPEMGQRLAVLTLPQPASIAALAFSPDNACLAALQWDGNVQVWELTVLRRELSGLGLDWEMPPTGGR